MKRYADVNMVLTWFAKALGLEQCQTSASGTLGFSADNKENVQQVLINGGSLNSASLPFAQSSNSANPMTEVLFH